MWAALVAPQKRNRTGISTIKCVQKKLCKYKKEEKQSRTDRIHHRRPKWRWDINNQRRKSKIETAATTGRLEKTNHRSFSDGPLPPVICHLCWVSSGWLLPEKPARCPGYLCWSYRWMSRTRAGPGPCHWGPGGEETFRDDVIERKRKRVGELTLGLWGRWW